MITVPLAGTTIPHQIEERYGASIVLLKPAAPGTGVIAGGGVRAVLEAAGVKDVLTKAHGSSNPVNVVRATIKALEGTGVDGIGSPRAGDSGVRFSARWRRKQRAAAVVPRPVQGGNAPIERGPQQGGRGGRGGQGRGRRSDNA